MIDDGLGFSLVPWRPVIEKEIGREVVGVLRGNDVSWGSASNIDRCWVPTPIGLS
jgi:Protein of unknown function (DUF3363)